MAVIAICQGMTELCGLRRRKWSRNVVVIAICQGMMELRGIHRRKWSRIVVVAVLHQKVRIRWLKFGSGRSGDGAWLP